MILLVIILTIAAIYFTDLPGEDRIGIIDKKYKVKMLGIASNKEEKFKKRRISPGISDPKKLEKFMKIYGHHYPKKKSNKSDNTEESDNIN